MSVIPRNPQETGIDDAVKILSGLKDRIVSLESDRLGGSQQVQLFRDSTDMIGCTDAITVTEGSAGNFRWGTSTWGFDEFGQTR